MADPSSDEGGVDRKLVQGQGPSSLIIPIELQRQMLRAFDISFILVFCSFVQLSLYRSAAGVSTIASCFPDFNSLKVVYVESLIGSIALKSEWTHKANHFQRQKVPPCLLLIHEFITLHDFIVSFPSHTVRTD